MSFREPRPETMLLSLPAGVIVGILLVVLLGCAHAHVDPEDGEARAWAFGQASAAACPVDAEPEEGDATGCVVANGGPLSEGVVGLLTWPVRAVVSSLTAAAGTP